MAPPSKLLVVARKATILRWRYARASCASCGRFHANLLCASLCAPSEWSQFQEDAAAKDPNRKRNPRGTILAADIQVGEKLADGYAIETVFDRRKVKSRWERLRDYIHDDLYEGIYYKHFYIPEPPEEDDDPEEVAETLANIRRIKRNRLCVKLLLLLLLLLPLLVVADESRKTLLAKTKDLYLAAAASTRSLWLGVTETLSSAGARLGAGGLVTPVATALVLGGLLLAGSYLKTSAGLAVLGGLGLLGYGYLYHCCTRCEAALAGVSAGRTVISGGGVAFLPLLVAFVLGLLIPLIYYFCCFAAGAAGDDDDDGEETIIGVQGRQRGRAVSPAPVRSPAPARPRNASPGPSMVRPGSRRNMLLRDGKEFHADARDRDGWNSWGER